MSAANSLLPELDDIVRQGDPVRRADAVRRIADLYIRDAESFQPNHVALFDGILLTLVPEIDVEVRGELARRFSEISNAPPELVRQLVHDEDIGIAGPLLRRSVMLDDPTLVELAKQRGQTHLLAISERASISPPVTDVIVRRGDRDVVRKVAGNAGAEFSATGFNGLIRRAAEDGVLAIAVGTRDDLSPPRLKDLLACSTDLVRRRLFESARPSARIAINRAMRELAGESRQPTVQRDFEAAQRSVVGLHNKGELNEATVLGFAQAHQYEETVAALSAMTGTRISTLDQMMSGERHDPVLILGKALGFGWATVRALIRLRLGPDRSVACPDVEEAQHNFERLTSATAQRVLGFWRMRQADA